MVACVVQTPQEVIKQRLQTGMYSSFWGGLVSVWVRVCARVRGCTIDSPPAAPIDRSKRLLGPKEYEASTLASSQLSLATLPRYGGVSLCNDNHFRH